MKELLQEYEALRRSRDDAEKTSAECKERMTQLEEQILEELTNNGLQNTTSETGMKFFKKKERWVSAKEGIEKAEMIRVLANDPHFADLVNPQVNAMSLRARYQEVLDSGEALNPETERVLKVVETTKLGTRK